MHAAHTRCTRRNIKVRAVAAVVDHVQVNQAESATVSYGTERALANTPSVGMGKKVGMTVMLRARA